MIEHIVTVTVPPSLYAQLKQRADRMQRSIEDEVVMTLVATVPAEAALPADLGVMLASLGALDDETLYRLAASRVADADAARLAELGDQRQRTGLSDEEVREADDLVQRHDRVMVVRAEAAALLKQRGCDIGAFSPSV